MKQPYELIPTNPCPFCDGKSKTTCVRNALGTAKPTPNGLELATIILSKLEKHTFKVTPNLSVDDPAGLEGFKLYEQSLVMAFEMGAKK